MNLTSLPSQGRAYLALLRKRVLPALTSAAFTGKVVVYIGTGGFKTEPADGEDLARMARLRNVAAVYVEGGIALRPEDDRPSNLHNAPTGVW